VYGGTVDVLVMPGISSVEIRMRRLAASKVTEPDGRQLTRLLRASRERPAGQRTAEQRDEFSP
jgi:hypothetical protein